MALFRASAASTMFATAITAWRRSQPDIRSRSVPMVNAKRSRALLGRLRVDRIHQRPSSTQPLDRKPLRRRRNTTIGPLLAHSDPPPPIDLAHKRQPSASALRKQHDKAVPRQRMERMSDHQ